MHSFFFPRAAARSGKPPSVAVEVDCVDPTAFHGRPRLPRARFPDGKEIRRIPQLQAHSWNTGEKQGRRM